MMQLLCNGVRLDLYDNVELQFKHSNPIFAFDKLECERTTEFKLPATPTNDRVFGLARIPAYNGAGMMVQFPAELQVGTLVRTGYLYVSKYEKDYAAILVTGEMVKLLAAKEAGNVKDYMSNDTSAYGQISGYAAQYTLIQTLRYQNESQADPSNPGVSIYVCRDSIVRPCISLYVMLITYLYQKFNIGGINNIPQDLRGFVYIPANCVDSTGQTIETAGTMVYAKYNIPDWTITDVLKIVAYAGGYSVNFEDGEVSFLNSLADFSGVVDITKRLTKRDAVSRTILDYAQDNYLNWKDEDEYRLKGGRAKYNIANANLKSENQLFEIPMQPARIGRNSLALCWDNNSINSFLPDRPIVPMGSEWLANMVLTQYDLRPFYTDKQIPTNPIVQAVTDAATQIEVECRMSMLEYYAIKNTSIIQVDNTQYIWLERSWQNDTAKFTLSKLA